MAKTASLNPSLVTKKGAAVPAVSTPEAQQPTMWRSTDITSATAIIRLCSLPESCRPNSRLPRKPGSISIFSSPMAQAWS